MGRRHILELLLRYTYYSMRFQVPQNLDVPDTIFLGLNFKQLLYLGGAVGFAIFLYLFLGGIGPAILFGGPVAVLAGFLSFFTYNNQPFSAVLQSLIRFVTRKKMYMWRKSAESGQVGVVSRRGLSDDVSSAPSQSKGPEKIREASTNLVFSDDVDFDSDLDVVI